MSNIDLINLLSNTREPTTICITVTFIFYSFFKSLVRSIYLFVNLLSFAFTMIRWNAKIQLMLSSNNTTSGALYIKVSRILCFSFSMTDSGLWMYHLSAWPKFRLLHNFQRNIFPHTIFNSFFFTSLLNSLIVWLTISSPSSHTLHFLFFCELVLMAIFWAAFKRDSISVLRFLCLRECFRLK